MVIRHQGETLQLRDLTDDEYDAAARLARIDGTPLDTCITCGGSLVEIPESNGVKVFESKKYRFLGNEYECECKAQIALRARYLLANIGDQYWGLDWDRDFDGSQEARDFVSHYLDKWSSFKRHGWGVEFGGPLGVGKTFAATHIGKALIQRNQKVYFIPFVEMVSAFEKHNGYDIEERIRNTTYVIIDELRPAISDRQREFYATRFEAVIRHRTNFNLPTIITTNVSQDDLYQEYPRIYSLLAAKQSRIEMSGEDVRLGKVKIENMELIENDEVRLIT